MDNRQGVNSLSIVARSSTLQSVHYQRFHCNRKVKIWGLNLFFWIGLFLVSFSEVPLWGLDTLCLYVHCV